MDNTLFTSERASWRLRRVALIALAAGSLSLVACSDDGDAEATSTPAVEATAAETAAATEVAATPAATEMAEDMAHDASAGALLAALRLVDTAGFHGMDETLNGDTPAIDASWVGAANHAISATQAVTWPGESEAVAATFLADAQALVVALDADDVAAAAPLAAAVHESQHAFSHAAFHELEHLGARDASPGAMLAALIYLDNVGFHGMDEALNGDAPEIDPSWAGATNNALAAARSVDWGEVQPQADAFIAAAEELFAALQADDAAAAAAPAAAVHETQHALSHDAYAALDGMKAADDSVAARLAAIILADTAGFHGMDEALNGDAPEIVASWTGATSRALTAARVVAWGEQQAAADAFIAGATELLAALEADDASSAAAPAAVVHEAQHALSHDVYAAIGGGHDH